MGAFNPIMNLYLGILLNCGCMAYSFINQIKIDKMNDSSRKTQTIKRKPMNQIGQRNVKWKNKDFDPKGTRSPELKNSHRTRIQQNVSILQANVSAIEAQSFFSNKQDGSMDSMDKMIIGVGLDERQYEEDENNQNQSGVKTENEQSRGSRLQIDFNEINQQYEQLFDRKKLLGEQQEDSANSTDQQVFLEQSWQESEQKNYPKTSNSFSVKKTKEHIQRLQLRVQQVKYSRKLQDISNNSIKILTGNLSQIHEQRQNHINKSSETPAHITQEEDEQDFYDFVSQPDPQQVKQEKKGNSFEREGEEWEQQNPMLANLQLDLSKDKNFCEKKLVEQKENFQPILQGLNSKEEEDVCYLEQVLQRVFKKREEWIQKQTQKGNQWKQKQIEQMNKMKKIMRDPEYDSSEQSG